MTLALPPMDGDGSRLSTFFFFSIHLIWRIRKPDMKADSKVLDCIRIE